ncbi:hypothetical protein RZS08_64775, partial [Arthrospira platensis SPKY1]|nr:hypothetical protein [Arthrospira platensis SPKY1]
MVEQIDDGMAADVAAAARNQYFVHKLIPLSEISPKVSQFHTMERIELAKAVVQIARQAGAAIMAIYAQEDVGLELKADESPLTLADKAANDLICAGLAELP